MPYKNGKEVYNKIIFTEEQLEDMKQSYLNGESSVKIGKRYGTNHKPILRELHNMGIEVDQKRFARKYKLNEHFFDIIDDQNKAYCLGFIAADGCNFPSKSTISMSLEECDKEILEKICLVMGNEHPLEYIDYKDKHDFGYTYKNQYRMLMFSTHMCNQLMKLGIVPNKSLKLEFPSNISDKYKRDFLRGYFDGDGSLGFKDISSFSFYNAKQLNITIVSTNAFCIGAKEYIEKELGICVHISKPLERNGITSTLFIGAKDNKLFLDWLYNDAELYLKRKHDIYLKYLSINNSRVA